MARLSRSWRAFGELSWAHRRLLAWTWLLLPLTAIGLRVLGFRRLQALLHRTEGATDRRDDLTEAQATARIVRGAALWSPLHANCLARSVLLCRLLHRQGLAAELRIGVNRPGGRVEAHAWVEHVGKALNESQDLERRFAAFDGAVLSGGTGAP